MKKIVLFILMISRLFAYDTDASKILTSTPVSNFGNEFWLSIPPFYTDESAGYANYVKVFVTSQVKTNVSIEVPRKGFKQIKSTLANDVIEFNILPGVGQPYEKSGSEAYVPDQVFSGAGIHIMSDQPIACYVVVRYHGSSDGYLALPISSLGKEYIIAGFNEEGKYGIDHKLPNTTCIVAAFDDTEVEFTLGGNPNTITAGKLLPGQSKKWTGMKKGDVLTVSTARADADLTGSNVISTKPVSVITGNFCADIPTGNSWCSYIVEMDQPTNSWGRSYIVPKVPNRKFPSIIRIFAKEPNTDIFRDSIKIGNIKTSGGIEGEGFLSMRMSTYSIPPTPTRSVVIEGDKPINVTFYNTGSEEDGGSDNTDPFVMAILPVEQFQKEVIFCTPGIAGAMGFSNNYINLVYETNQYGQLPDDFEFATVTGGQYKWAKLKTKFPQTDELLTNKVNGKSYAVKLMILPGDGVYKIRSNTPFSAYSFGSSTNDSYGYPTAAGFVNLEKIDSIPPVPQYIVDASGNVFRGSVTDMPDDSTVRANMAMIVIDPTQSDNYNFTSEDFIPGEARTVKWELNIIDPTKDGKAVLVFADRRGNDTTITINYKAISNPYNINLISPIDSSDNQDTVLRFVWYKGTLPQYKLMIDIDSGFKKNTRSFDLGNTTRLVSGLRPLTTYFWKVLSLRNDTILGSSTTWTFKTKSIVSVSDLTLSQTFIINPNPATDFIEISVGAGSKPALTNDVRIYDVFGQIQTSPSLRDTPPYQGGEKVRINVSGLAPGMYFVRIGDRVQKFVKL